MARSLLVTGGAGFIGSNFVRLALSAGHKVTVLDALTYAGNLENLDEFFACGDFSFIKGNICHAPTVSKAMAGVDWVVNFAAETHVDRSISSSGAFLETNVIGTGVLLDCALEQNVALFLQVSTDEVYGALGDEGSFNESSPLRPNSPYAASKASADLLVRSYINTYGLPAVISRCSNNYGPYQFPEKLIPLMVTNALDGKQLPVYGDGLQVRDWIHVDDHCNALLAILDAGKGGEIYNIGADTEKANIDVVRTILAYLGMGDELIRYVEDRPGHDRRYAIDASKITGDLGWRPEKEFSGALAETVDWYCSNRSWWEKIKSGEYMDYYRGMYADRIRKGRSEV